MSDSRIMGKWILYGAGAGGALGALSGAATRPHPHKSGKRDKDYKKRKLKGIAGEGLMGALTGAYIGANAGKGYIETGAQHQDAGMGARFKQRYEDAVRAMHPGEAAEAFNLAGTERTRSEVLRKVKKRLFEAHPDRGGTHEGFIKLRKLQEGLEKTPWFRKLASASNLPSTKVLSKQRARQAESAAKAKWKGPSALEKLREYLKTEPEIKTSRNIMLAAGAGVGAGAGLAAGIHRRIMIERARKAGKLSDAEAAALKRKHGIIASTVKNTALGAVGSLIPFYALQRKRPVAGLTAGALAGMSTPLIAHRVTGPGGPFRSAAEEKYMDYHDKEILKQEKLRKELNKSMYGY